METIDHNAIAHRVHSIAKAHGWWDKPPSLEELSLLCASELFEALEAYRSNQPSFYFMRKEVGIYTTKTVRCTAWEDYKNEKPEGVLVELADCAIRIYDLCGRYKIDLNRILIPVTYEHRNFTSFLFYVNHALTLAGTYSAPPDHPEAQFAMTGGVDYFVIALSAIIAYFSLIGEDFLTYVHAKMAYNQTRPYRHGGKRL